MKRLVASSCASASKRQLTQVGLQPLESAQLPQWGERAHMSRNQGRSFARVEGCEATSILPGRCAQEFVQFRLWVGEAFDATQLRQVDLRSAPLVSSRFADGTFVGKQPRLGHANRHDADVGNLRVRRAEQRDGFANLVVTKLRILFLRIAMDEQDVARREVERSLELCGKTQIRAELGLGQELVGDRIRPVGLADEPAENREQRAVSRAIGKECELNVPHCPLSQLEQELLRFVAVNQPRLLERVAVR